MPYSNIDYVDNIDGSKPHYLSKCLAHGLKKEEEKLATMREVVTSWEAEVDAGGKSPVFLLLLFFFFFLFLLAPPVASFFHRFACSVRPVLSAVPY